MSHFLGYLRSEWGRLDNFESCDMSSFPIHFPFYLHTGTPLSSLTMCRLLVCSFVFDLLVSLRFSVALCIYVWLFLSQCISCNLCVSLSLSHIFVLSLSLSSLGH